MSIARYHRRQPVSSSGGFFPSWFWNIGVCFGLLCLAGGALAWHYINDSGHVVAYLLFGTGLVCLCCGLCNLFCTHGNPRERDLARRRAEMIKSEAYSHPTPVIEQYQQSWWRGGDGTSSGMMMMGDDDMYFGAGTPRAWPPQLQNDAYYGSSPTELPPVSSFYPQYGYL
eukprot:TRINITY_DN93886_c0_g1_i1.p1 TRINITY_DN93886_c0_g1~~TRINITY_DN93886_c0_g1_i1.p1  ORF type:complete len:170 (+),score=10.93 TRINITY_DN93886_c0_g1_i1:53-562(+)